MRTGRLERSSSPAPLLSSPGLLLRSASWERLESSAGANKAGRYARAQEREEEREADDDVTWERNKIQKWGLWEKDEETEQQRCVTGGLETADFTKHPIVASCTSCTILYYMVSATHLQNGSQSAPLSNELSSKHTAALHRQRQVVSLLLSPEPDILAPDTKIWLHTKHQSLGSYIMAPFSDLQGQCA